MPKGTAGHELDKVLATKKMEEKGITTSHDFFSVLSLGRDDEGKKKKLLQLCPIITIQSVITGKGKKGIFS